MYMGEVKIIFLFNHFFKGFIVGLPNVCPAQAEAYTGLWASAC